MVGQGVLREALRADDVMLVQTVGRSRTGVTHAKLREVLHAELLDYTSIEGTLIGFDACFICLVARPPDEALSCVVCRGQLR